MNVSFPGSKSLESAAHQSKIVLRTVKQCAELYTSAFEELKTEALLTKLFLTSKIALALLKLFPVLRIELL